MSVSISKIISGGQTGADRAALDWAIEHQIPHGGYCPKGRLAEDGIIPDRYGLIETRSKDYLKRTEQNVKESDGTVIFTMGPKLKGGSKRTAEFAEQHRKPWLHLWQIGQLEVAAAALKFFIEEHRIQTLNVAGSRASKEPDVGEFVRRVLSLALGDNQLTIRMSEPYRWGCPLPEVVQALLERTPITDLELGCRGMNCLQNAGFVTIADAVEGMDEDFPKRRNVGRKSTAEIKRVVETFIKSQLEAIGCDRCI